MAGLLFKKSAKWQDTLACEHEKVVCLSKQALLCLQFIKPPEKMHLRERAL